MKELTKTGSDFCGVGAFDQALELLGIQQDKKYACDMDKFARQTYCLNYGTPADVELSKSLWHNGICDALLKCAIKGVEPDEALKNDAEVLARQFSFYFPIDVYLRDIPKDPLDIYMTSPPCQAFSMAGNRKGKDDHRGILFFNSWEFIKVNKPRFFIFENVKGLLSHDKPANSTQEFGRTFNEWINYLGGKSVNGNPIFFPYDDAVPYHIHFRVINAKHFGVPQNRERVFIVGIRDDADNDFHWPKKIHLNRRIKDVLESDVDAKYFLSQKMIDGFIRHAERHAERQNGFAFKPNDLEKEARAITTNSGSRNTDNYIELGFINQESQSSKVFSPDGTSPTITAKQGGGHEPKIIQKTIVEMVKVRKHDVDIEGLKELLKRSKVKSIKEISEHLDLPKTKVEHWFRGDKSFSIPDAEYWKKLKLFLNITEDKFDESIMEFEEKENEFEKSNRCYDENGISPTITATSADEKIFINEIKVVGNYNESGHEASRAVCENGIAPTVKENHGTITGVMTGIQIRRLTPRECFRLMGFPDSFRWECSDSQAYKQAGNSIVREPLAAIIAKLKL